MSGVCEAYDGAGVVGHSDAGPFWMARPSRIHIAKELAVDPEAIEFISDEYAIAAGCTPGVLHGTRRPTPTPSEEQP